MEAFRPLNLFFIGFGIMPVVGTSHTGVGVSLVSPDPYTKVAVPTICRNFVCPAPMIRKPFSNIIFCKGAWGCTSHKCCQTTTTSTSTSTTTSTTSTTSTTTSTTTTSTTTRTTTSSITTSSTTSTSTTSTSTTITSTTITSTTITTTTSSSTTTLDVCGNYACPELFDMKPAPDSLVCSSDLGCTVEFCCLKRASTLTTLSSTTTPAFGEVDRHPKGLHSTTTPISCFGYSCPDPMTRKAHSSHLVCQEPGCTKEACCSMPTTTDATTVSQSLGKLPCTTVFSHLYSAFDNSTIDRHGVSYRNVDSKMAWASVVIWLGTGLLAAGFAVSVRRRAPRTVRRVSVNGPHYVSVQTESPSDTEGLDE